jgi:hypothetical protein
MKWIREVKVVEPDNICSPCWSESRREVDAVVAFETLDTVTRHFESINYCGHHAEVLHSTGLQSDEGVKQ